MSPAEQLIDAIEAIEKDEICPIDMDCLVDSEVVLLKAFLRVLQDYAHANHERVPPPRLAHELRTGAAERRRLRQQIAELPRDLATHYPSGFGPDGHPTEFVLLADVLKLLGPEGA